jgi:hypothetical protein
LGEKPSMVLLMTAVATLQQLSDFLIAVAPIAGAIAAIIAIYRFFINQPALVLEADVESTSPDRAFHTVHTTPTLFLSNEGRDFAEDAYLEMDLPDWDFEQEDDEENISTFLDVTSDRTGYLGSPRRLYQVTVDKPVQPRERYKMFFGGAELERNRCYELNYTISCRSHGPREGCIKFHVGHHEVTVENTYPKRRRRYFLAFREFFDGQNTLEPEVDLLEFEVNWESESTASIEALLKNSGPVRNRITEVRFDLSVGNVCSENYWRSIPVKIWGLDPGEFWQVNVELELELDEPHLSKEDISLDCFPSANTNHLKDSWDRVTLIDSGAELPNDSFSITQAFGRLENLNAGTSRGTRIVVKWLDEDGVVLGTDETQMELSPGEAEDFRVNCSADRERQEEIEDYSITLMGG